MDIMERKRRDNAAAYVISMWHIEDLMRAHDLSIDTVHTHLVEPMEGDEEDRQRMRTWYADIIRSMREQGIEQRGHLAEVLEVINELEHLHDSLLDMREETEYHELHEQAEPGIRAVQDHGGEDDGTITTCFVAIYGVMLLRAQGKPISEATSEAEGHIRRLLEKLSEHYRHMRRLPGISLN